MSWLDGYVHPLNYHYKKKYEKEAFEALEKLGDLLTQVDVIVKELRYYIMESKFWGDAQLEDFFASLYETRPLYDRYNMLINSMHEYLKEDGRILKLVPKKIKEIEEKEKEIKEEGDRYGKEVLYPCPFCGTRLKVNILEEQIKEKGKERQLRTTTWQKVIEEYQNKKQEIEDTPAEQYKRAQIEHYNEIITSIEDRVVNYNKR